MSSNYEFVVTAKHVKKCQVYKEGDKFAVCIPQIVADKLDKVCVHALSAFLPFLMAAEAGTSFEDLKIGRGDTALMQCVDVNGGVVFEIKKIQI